MKLGMILLAVLLVSTIMVSSCRTDADESALVDRVWVLETYGETDNLKNVLQDTKISATFNSDERDVTGSAGCNQYFADYVVKGNNLSILEPIGQTEMACPEPEGVMEQERQYFIILKSAESYQIQGNELRINCGEKVLVYTTQ